MVENTKSIPFPVLELSDTSWINQLDVAITSTREKDLGFSGWKDKSSALPIFWPSVARLADEIKKILGEKTGGCIVRAIPNDSGDVFLTKWAFLLLMGQIGNPTGHDDKCELVWDVRHRQQPPAREVTFSERTGEAPFHTDSAFADNPEPFFALHAIKAAGCNGGMSRVIGVDSLKKQLNLLKNGNNIMEDLTIHHFPFRTPEAFSSEGKTIWAPIFDDKGIRYRYDSIKRGLSHSKNDNRVTREMVESLEWFNEFIETKAEYEKFRLNDGETMIFDNRRVLHARTDYEDVKRHLLRIRVS